jgi:hypothetical protein
VFRARILILLTLGMDLVSHSSVILVKAGIYCYKRKNYSWVYHRSFLVIGENEFYQESKFYQFRHLAPPISPMNFLALDTFAGSIYTLNQLIN